MKKMTMRTILAAGFAMASLLPTLSAHAVTGNIAVQPNDPIAMTYQRTLEDPSNAATTVRPNDAIAMTILDVAANCATTGQPHDPIAMAYWRTLEVAGNCATNEQPNDPIAMAHRRAFEGVGDSAINEQMNDPIAMAYQRTHEDPTDAANTAQFNDPIAMAHRRAFEGFVDAATTVQPNDPIAMAYRRTLEGVVDFANTAQPDDSLVGENVGGVNVSGGAVGLYATGGTLVGALGVSGNTSCTDYVIPWRLRQALGFGQVPVGVHPGPDGSTDHTNIYLVGGETPNGFNAPHALHQPPIRILILLSKGGL
ncbi:MAG: hypothetical protein K8G79_12995 [bacterium]|uniref:Secreted protein n=1 Tax=Candidatus Methylomirabilis tolerans TaxID=3123416 RepID=A0AAJ1EKB4_9BACT|nr:hypothetical protein [Candidatus Methylomirabilis sp.]